MKQVELSDDERRLLTISMTLISTGDAIQIVDDDDLVRQLEETYESGKQEFDELFDRIDQQALIEKLS